MTTGEVIANSLQNLFNQIAEFIPVFVVAVVVLILGWLIGMGLGNLVQRFLEMIKIDAAANTLGLDRLSARTGKKLSIAAFGNWLVKWFFIIATFVAAANILNLNQVSAFLYDDVIPYFGNVIVAVAIMVIGGVSANFLQDVVRHSLQAGGLHTAETAGTITKWAILIFAILAALSQLRVAEDFLEELFKAIVWMLAGAGAIAFGLGGKDHAKKFLDSVEKDAKGK